MRDLLVFLFCIGLFACKESRNVNDWVEEDLAKPHPISKIQILGENLPKNKVVSDPVHSSITFQIGHWEIVDLFGWFRDFEVVMLHDKADFSDAVIEARVNPKEVILPSPQMEGHIQHKEYFHSEKYPFIIFKSRKMEPIDSARYKLIGDFIIRDVQLEKELEVTFKGYAYPEKSISGWEIKGFVTQSELGWDHSPKIHSGKKILNDTIWFEADLRME